MTPAHSGIHLPRQLAFRLRGGIKMKEPDIPLSVDLVGADFKGNHFFPFNIKESS